MTMTGRRFRVAAAAAGLLALLAAGVGDGAASQLGEITAAPGGDVAVTRDPNPIIARNSPVIAVNPVQRTNMVVVDRVNRPDFSAGVHVSNDGGTNWQDIALKVPGGKPFSPSAAYDGRGTLY